MLDERPEKPRRPLREARIALQGEEARRWLSLHGWSVPMPPEDLRVFADTISFSDIRLSRIWTTPCTRVSVHRDEDVVLIAVDGAARLRTPEEDSEAVLQRGDFALHSPSSAVSVRADAPFAHVEALISSTLLQAHRLASRHGVHRADPSILAMLLGATNGLLSTGSVPRTGIVNLRRASIDMLMALVAEPDRAGLSRMTTADADLLARALTVIDSRFTTVGFGPTDIASELGVSLRTVHRVFSEAGRQPAAAIRARRVEEARRHLATVTATRVGELNAIAASTGFPSRRAMREALHSSGARSERQWSGAERAQGHPLPAA